MRRNYSTNNYRSLRENAKYGGQMLNERAITKDDVEAKFAERFGEENLTGALDSSIKGLYLLFKAVKMLGADEQVEVMQIVIDLFTNEVAKGQAGREVKTSVKQDKYEFEAPASEKEPKMESRYRSGSRLNESRRSVQRPNRRYNY